MPITIKTGNMKYKDSNGQYVDINAVGSGDIESAVDNWLYDHPEATTTVEDGSITKAKLDSNLQGTVDDVGDLKNAIDGKQDILTFDSQPTQNSTNPVTSGGIYTSMGYKMEKPALDGSAGDVLLSDGNGGSAWGDLGNIDGVGITIANDTLVISSSGGGGGDGGTWTLIKEVTNTESSVIEITTDSNGDSLQLKNARILIKVPAEVTTSSFNVEVFGGSTKVAAAYAAAKSGSSIGRLPIDVYLSHGYWESEARGTMATDNFTNVRKPLNDTYYFMKYTETDAPYITKIKTDSAVPAGVTVKVWTAK